MKKYWQIKPWMFLVLVLILATSLFYAFGNNLSQNNTKSVSLGGMGVSYAPSIAMDSAASTKEIFSRDMAVSQDTDESAEERMIIKTGNLSLVVNDVRKSVEEITKYVEEKKGFLVSSDVSKADIGVDVSGSLTVRVPSDLLEDTILYVKGLGDVRGEHIDGRDITEEYVDLESKLGNLQATETQFLEIMKKAVKIEDVLAVQKELSYVRENIESIKGRMKYLNESVDLSSLTIYLSTNPSTLPVIEEGDQWKPIAVFKEAIRSLLDMGKEVVNGLIWFGVYLPILAVILLIIWRVRKHIAKKKK